MRLSARWWYAAAAIAAMLIAVSAIVQSVRQDSWSPLLSAGWLAAVIIVVIAPRGTRRCLQIRRRQTR
jgi:hypothetical protein